MDKHLGNTFEPSVVGEYTGFVGSPGLGDDIDDGFGSGKRKGSGIRMFGDLEEEGPEIIIISHC